MSRFLIVDIGAGTMDVLYFEDGSDLHYKAVVKSPVRYVSEMAENARGDLLLTGCEMGGGRLAGVLRDRARRSRVYMTASAALTLSHDLEKTASWGIRLVSDEEAAELARIPGVEHIVLGDVRRDHLERITEGFGVPFEFDYLGVCAQDHGTPPVGMSHLDFRHNTFREALEKTPFAHALLHEGTGVPPTFNRLGSIALAGASLPAGRCFVMDSGMAAITGAAMDFDARKCGTVLVLDVATSHTVGAALSDGELAGFFEYHTSDITVEKLDALLRGLADGTLEHSRVLKEGGHGAYVRKPVGFRNVERIVATGPKRALVAGSRLDISFGSPLGDNMMTGTLGVLEAIRRRENMAPLTCV